MKSKQECLVFFILCLLIGTCFASVVSSQEGEEEPNVEVLTVTLNTPENATTITSFNATFTYIPVTNGTNDLFVFAKLYINGTDSLASNQTAIANNTVNSISYTFASNGTYLWNVQVRNSSANVLADADFLITVAVPEEPEPTPMPTPTMTPTPAPTVAPTPTATPTSPPPSEFFGLSAEAMVIIAVIIILIIIAAAIVLLRRR